jgi:hypothetical protein
LSGLEKIIAKRKNATLFDLIFLKKVFDFFFLMVILGITNFQKTIEHEAEIMLKESMLKNRKLHFKTAKKNPLAKKIKAKQEESFLRIYRRLNTL